MLFFMLISCYVEYYLTHNGCLVNRLPICMNGVDDVQVWVHIACEGSRISLELPLYLLLGV